MGSSGGVGAAHEAVIALRFTDDHLGVILRPLRQPGMPTPMRRFRSALIIGAGLVLLLSSCANQTRIYRNTVTTNYRPAEYGYGAGRRDLMTVVRGDPFGLGEQQFEAAMIEVLARHPPRPQPTNFTTTPGPSARLAYRAVFLFDAPPALLDRHLCRLPLDVPRVETGEAVRITAAFCRNQGLLTAVTGDVRGGVVGIDDPKFDALINLAIAGLFPNKDPDRDNDDRPRLFISSAQ